MKNKWRELIAWSGLSLVGVIAAGALATPAHADDGRFYGMLRSRDLTPFGFLRLDMRPAHAVSIEPHTFAFEAELGYQNTWALSRNVEKYLTSLEASGRREIGPAEIDAIRNLPGENYLLDLESATLDLTMHYKLSSQWSVYVIATAVSYQGGFMDWGIEKFHDALGFSTFGRHAIARNGTHLIYDLKNTQVVLSEPPKSPGFLDPTFGLRYVGIKLPGKWQMSVETAVKVPLDGERPLLSTGRTDYGLQTSVRRLGERNALHVDLAAVYYAGEDLPSPHDAQVVPTIVVGWERQMTARTNLNLQGYASKSVYRRAQTDLDELLSDKYQLSLGFRHRFDCCVVSFAATENLQNLNNTPDVGFQMGFAWVPRMK
ncbi:MAG TPA: DUF3187 family protein [Steroidobacteraceae bacterium]|jgi:hypothetical protein|nr:DUF3187 family protein [Steroidobacteraceae bacterium]